MDWYDEIVSRVSEASEEGLRALENSLKENEDRWKRLGKDGLEEFVLKALRDGEEPALEAYADEAKPTPDELMKRDVGQGIFAMNEADRREALKEEAAKLLLDLGTAGLKAAVAVLVPF